MSYWSGDLMRGTAENPLNAHIDFGGLEVRLKGGANVLFEHKTPQTVIQNLHIVDPKQYPSDAVFGMRAVPYATTGVCGYNGCTEDAYYVNSEQDMKDWFANYNEPTAPRKTKCLKVTAPFVVPITVQLGENDYLQSKHYDFGGATIVHSLAYTLPSTKDTYPVVANLIVHMKSNADKVKAGILTTLGNGANPDGADIPQIVNCHVMFDRNKLSNRITNSFGGIVQTANQNSLIKDCSFKIVGTGWYSVIFKGQSVGGIAAIGNGRIDGCNVQMYPIQDGYGNSMNTENATNFGGLVGSGQTFQITNSSAGLYLTGVSPPYALYVGGLVGRIMSYSLSGSAKIKDSYSYGKQIQGREYVGGILGYVYGALPIECENVTSYIARIYAYTGAGVYGQADSAASLGGFAGYISAMPASTSFVNCSAYVPSIYASSSDSVVNMGGFAGYITSSNQGTMTNCFGELTKFYARGSAHSGTTIGGFVGFINGPLKNTTNCTGGLGSADSGTIGSIGNFFGFINDNVTADGLKHFGRYSLYGDRNTSYAYNVTNVTKISTPTSPTNPSESSGVTLRGTLLTAPQEGRTFTFTFKGFGDYYIDSLALSILQLGTSDQGAYTQIIYDGVLLSDMAFETSIASVSKSYKRGERDVPMTEKFLFTYLYKDAAKETEFSFRMTFKHSTTGEKRHFLLDSYTNKFVELKY